MVSDSSDTLTIYVFRITLQSDGGIWREIAIRGNQTLDDLHEAIFMAFDRFDERYYSFYIPDVQLDDNDEVSPVSDNDSDTLSSSPSSPSPNTSSLGVEYTHPQAAVDSNYWLDKKPNNASQTTIDSLNITEFFEFTYLFDFDENCMHNIILSRIEHYQKESISKTLNSYPRIVDSQGESPNPFAI